MKKVYKKEEIEKTKTFLLGLEAPEKTIFSTSEAISELADVIKDRINQGHSLETIVKALNDNGIEINLARFKTVWSKVSGGKRKKRKSTGNVQSKQTSVEGNDQT